MAIFSNKFSPQSVAAGPLPETTETKPSLIFGVPDCSKLTVTLQSSTNYQTTAGNPMTLRLQKIFVIDRADPMSVDVEVRVALQATGATPQETPKTMFKLTVDPHVRGEKKLKV